MGELNIYTLTSMIRGFSNEVTVKWLSFELGISYSTLARCKNGVWPRSVKFDAMKAVFDRCRDRFFGGDGEALVDSALGYLEREGVEASAFITARAQGGYDAFVDALILAAHASSTQRSTAQPIIEQGNSTQANGQHANTYPVAPAQASAGRVDAEAAQIETIDALDGFEAPSASGPKGEAFAANVGKSSSSREARSSRPGFSGFVVAIPVAAILLVGLLNIPLEGLMAWAADNQLAFAATLLVIAVSPVAVGILVDAPIAWHAYGKVHPEASFTWKNFCLVSKYGGISKVIPGAGRFDLTRRNCEFQLVCNVLGALCTISLLAFLVRQPGFESFFSDHQWTEFFKVGLAVGFFVAFSHNREHRLYAPCARVGDAHNPDCNLPTRAHVWANTLHLIVTFTIVCVLTLGLIAYSFVNFRVYPAPLLVLWPLFQTIAFLVYEGVSPAAERMEALGVGAFEPGVIASSVGIAALMLVCYRFSWETAVVCLVCLACLAGVLVWRRSLAAETPVWIERGRISGTYSLAVVAALAVMFAIGAGTGSLL